MRTACTSQAAISDPGEVLVKLCQEAGVDPEKVNPRSLAHVVAFGSAVYTLDDKLKEKIDD